MNFAYAHYRNRETSNALQALVWALPILYDCAAYKADKHE